MHKIAEIRAKLRSFGSAHARESRLFFGAGPVYVLLTTRAPRRSVRCQAVASASLPPAHKLDARGVERLRELGYEKKGTPRGWTREVDNTEESLAALADELFELLTDLYRVDSEALRVEVLHDDTEHPQNPALISAIEALARNNADPTQRHRVYTELLNAILLVPLDPNAGDEVEPGEDLLVTERVGDRPVFTVFTDWDALCSWNPRTWPYRPMRGAELLGELADRRAAAVDINPKGRAGGQLFAHEVEMLARAARDWKRKHLD